MTNTDLEFLIVLQDIVVQRRDRPVDDSYTSKLFSSGRQRIAQKVGEEAVEVALAACNGVSDEVKDEAADLLYHLLVLLADRRLTLGDVVKVLESRHSS